ncbi:MAG: hypothetical protein KGJ78_10705 [Alphaproteobacteria bacterium]|nr:hypothetical protein [Alphaproteobacteria bacterium]
MAVAFEGGAFMLVRPFFAVDTGTSTPEHSSDLRLSSAYDCNCCLALSAELQGYGRSIRDDQRMAHIAQDHLPVDSSNFWNDNKRGACCSEF